MINNLIILLFVTSLILHIYITYIFKDNKLCHINNNFNFYIINIFLFILGLSSIYLCC